MNKNVTYKNIAIITFYFLFYYPIHFRFFGAYDFVWACIVKMTILLHRKHTMIDFFLSLETNVLPSVLGLTLWSHYFHHTQSCLLSDCFFFPSNKLKAFWSFINFTIAVLRSLTRACNFSFSFFRFF